MARRPQVVPVQLVEFHRTKYGRELLIDAAFISRLPGFDRSERPQMLTFHDVTLVTRGTGLLELDGVEHCLRPGVVFFSRPGDVRRWRVRGLDGACFFFTAEFVGEAFADARFLDQFRFFRADRPSGALALTPTQRRLFRERFSAMEREIRSLGPDASDALRALLYEMLVLLNRWYLARHGTGFARRIPGPVERFLSLVERDFARGRRLADYARELGVSPGHLSALCRSALGQGAAAWVRGRIALEARRLLRFTDLGAAEVGYRLGFEDPSYFARFVRREIGASPSRVRRGEVRVGGP